ncbi:hypothetical protein BKA93DRAFT_798934 [Sparassis latifolia]
MLRPKLSVLIKVQQSQPVVEQDQLVIEQNQPVLDQQPIEQSYLVVDRIPQERCTPSREFQTNAALTFEFCNNGDKFFPARDTLIENFAGLHPA